MTTKFIPKLDPELLNSADPYDLDVTNPDNWSEETWEQAASLPKNFDWKNGVEYESKYDWVDDQEEDDEALTKWWENEGATLHLNLYESHWLPPATITLTPLELRCLLDSHAIMIREIDADDRMIQSALNVFDNACPNCESTSANNA